MHRRDFLKAMGAVTISGMFTGGCGEMLQSPKSTKQPNIIFMMSDDHGSAALSCYGSKFNTTPNMDRIAKEGMRLDNCFVNHSLCAPSRASILTGKYPHKNGQTSISGNYFDGGQLTVQKYFQQGGYETAIIGKWHLHSIPVGFDHYSVLWEQGTYFDPDFIEETEVGPAWIKEKGYCTDIVMDKTLNWLDGRDDDKPFMLMCHFKSPHYNWEPDEKHEHMYKDDLPKPSTFDHKYPGSVPPMQQQVPLEKVHEMWKIKHWDNMPEGLSEAQQKDWNFQRVMKDYLRCVASVDDNIGRLLDYLDNNGLAEDTIIIYTSDNGFFHGDHGWVDKKMIYEESIRVPFVIRYPGHIKPGTSSDAICTNCDYAPTFLDYASMAIPDDMQGRSMRAVLSGKTPRDWRDAFYYQYWAGNRRSDMSVAGVRSKRYKLAHYFNNKSEDQHVYQLFDLKNDPTEIDDLANDPDHRITLAMMKKKMAQLRKELEITDEIEAKIFDGYRPLAEGKPNAIKQLEKLKMTLDENTAKLEKLN